VLLSSIDDFVPTREIYKFGQSFKLEIRVMNSLRAKFGQPHQRSLVLNIDRATVNVNDASPLPPGQAFVDALTGSTHEIRELLLTQAHLHGGAIGRL
jgi:hypothetical protein